MRLHTLLTAALLILLALPHSLPAQSLAERFDRYYQALYRDREMNGNLAVSQKGAVIYRQSFGWEDQATKKPNGENSQFELASVSKLFTAVAVLQLKDIGLLGLDSPIQHYFPQFPYSSITIRHLLSHTSGLPDTETLVDSILSRNPAKQFTIQDELENVLLYSRGHTLESLPGEKWVYSSPGYHLLGLLVEKLSGQSLADYTSDHIFNRSGMTRSYIQTNLAQKQESGRTKNYQYDNHFRMKLQLVDTLPDWKEWTYNLALETGGTGVISTTGDMLRFNEALASGKLLDAKTLEEAYTPYRLNDGLPAQPFDLTYCGLGWFIFKDLTNGKIVWASGANPGTISFIASNLDRAECLVVLHNAKCNPFNDLNALGLFDGKEPDYHPSFAFHYAQDLFAHGRKYADDRIDYRRGDTTQYAVTEAEFNRASLELRREGLTDQAIAVCETHIRLFPLSADAYKDYAVTLNERGRRDLVISAYRKALALKPGDRESLDALKKLGTD
jgi:CubicO group peptidase (beta-lactamase class C family)